MDKVTSSMNGLNAFIDRLLYNVFGFEKLVPLFKKWVKFSNMLTSIMTILATTLMAFAIATIASAPSPRFSPYSNPYSHFSPSSSMETVEGGLSGGAIMAALIGGILVGVLLQYVVTLFSRANIGYFFGRKPVLSSMLIPRLASILGVLFIVATIIGICALKGVMIVVGILVLVCLFYLVWLHLNCNRIFVDINEIGRAHV